MISEISSALRSLVRRPGFVAVAVLTLALGIGINSAIFSVLNAIALRPLPFPEPDRIVAVFPERWFSKEEYRFLGDQAQPYRHLAAYGGAGAGFVFTAGDRSEMLDAMVVTASFFPVLGIDAAVGRTFGSEHEEPGTGAVVVLSHEFWQSRFAGDSAVVGTDLELDGRSHEVLGVLPPGVRFLPNEAALWVPLTFDPADRTDFGAHYLQLVGRLADGVTSAQAGQDLRFATLRMRDHFGLPEGTGAESSVIPLRDRLVGSVRSVLWTLFGAVGLILLIALANVGNLALAQAVDRRREMGVRLALGAGRLRLARQFITENVLVGVAGGALGLLLAVGGVRFLVARLPAGTPRTHEIAVDLHVLLYAVAISVGVGILFGLIPVLRAGAVGLQDALIEGGRTRSGTPLLSRAHGSLVVAETALAVVLLVCAGLMIRSFWQLQGVELGFEPRNVLTQRLTLPEDRYDRPELREAFFRDVQERLSAIGGVEAVGAIQFLPLTGNAWRGGVLVEGRPELDDRPPVVAWRVVTPGYLETLGVLLEEGRLLRAEDDDGQPGVAVISRSLANLLWPDGDPLGRRIRNGIEGSEGSATVVGVVADHRHEGPASDPSPVMYRPYGQVGRNLSMSILLRTRGDPSSVVEAASREIQGVDPTVPVYTVRTMERVAYESTAEPRVIMALLAGFAGVALVLGIIGVYGVMAYSVRSRTHEIGIRMALGAERGEVLRLTLRRALLMTLGGVAVGLVLALGITRLAEAFLFQVHPRDPVTFVIAPLVLVFGALLGSWLPSMRASRVDPAVALRWE
jgi:putative ABC transport system permease protein